MNFRRFLNIILTKNNVNTLLTFFIFAYVLGDGTYVPGSRHIDTRSDNISHCGAKGFRRHGCFQFSGQQHFRRNRWVSCYEIESRDYLLGNEKSLLYLYNVKYRRFGMFIRLILAFCEFRFLSWDKVRGYVEKDVFEFNGKSFCGNTQEPWLVGMWNIRNWREFLCISRHIITHVFN